MAEPTQSYLTQLFEDADRVLHYGHSTGRLKDASLAVALGKMRGADPVQDAATLLELQTAMAQAVRDIRPVTIADLRAGHDPCDPGRAKRITPLRATFFVLLMGLLWTTFYYSTWERQGVRLVESMRQNQIEKQDAILQELILGYVADAAQSDARDSVRASAALFARTRELQEIEERINADNAQHVELLQSWVPFRGWYVRVASASTVRPATAAPAKAAQAAQASVDHFSRCLNMGTFRIEAAKEPQALINFPDPRAAEHVSQVFAGDIRQQMKMLQTFRCILSLPVTSGFIDGSSVPVRALGADVSTIDKLDERIVTLNLWVLPALYGALGAMIFFGRGFLNPDIPDPHWMFFLARLCVAAFAGIAVGWFFENGIKIEGVTTSGGSPGVLLLAFIFGFALDVFFALLERLVSVSTDAVSRIGAKA
ncbi:MAG: hypothetical protein ACRCS0_03175 [Albidovulum sp.]